MTEEEKEFAALIDAYAGALTVRQMASSVKAKPEYATQDGYITPASIANYKKELADYEQHKANFEDAEQKVKEAKKALDAYFPPPVIDKFNRGVAMFANTLGGGTVALIKEDNEYLVFRGRDFADAKRKLDSRPPR